MKFPPASAVRLYVILARKAPFAVVFRRGPSKQVLVIGWNTETHEFRAGQWLKGRIYEHRCDLSPSGEKLIYFAAKYGTELRTWTAISRPPFLTALALWPKGDAWGGGGLFKDEKTVCLNHRKAESKRLDGADFPKGFSVEPLAPYAGRGEDDPIWSDRLARDGWVLKDPGISKTNKFGSRIWIEYPKPAVWQKAHRTWILESRLVGQKELNGPWYVMEHVIVDRAGREILSLGRTDWADWSKSGEVLFARHGRLYRLSISGAVGPGEPEELIDLRDNRFEAMEATPEALVWSGKGPRGSKIS